MMEIILLLILIVVSVTDIRYRVIPNRIMYPALQLGVVWRLFDHPLPLTNYLIAVAIGGGSFYLLALMSQTLLKKDGIGGGDIKLMALVGLSLGLKLTLFTLILAALIGWVCGIVFLLTKRLKKDAPLPFAPFISTAAAVAILWGDKLVQGYVDFMMTL